MNGEHGQIWIWCKSCAVHIVCLLIHWDGAFYGVEYKVHAALCTVRITVWGKVGRVQHGN